MPATKSTKPSTDYTENDRCNLWMALCFLWLFTGFAFFCAARFLLVPQPFVNTLADELTHVFKLARRLFPELLKLIRIERESISAPEPFRGSKLVFVISAELSRSHRDHCQRAARRQRLKYHINTRIHLLQPRKDAIVLVSTKRRRVFFPTGPLRLQRHA